MMTAKDVGTIRISPSQIKISPRKDIEIVIKVKGEKGKQRGRRGILESKTPIASNIDGLPREKNPPMDDEEENFRAGGHEQGRGDAFDWGTRKTHL